MRSRSKDLRRLAFAKALNPLEEKAANEAAKMTMSSPAPNYSGMGLTSEFQIAMMKNIVDEEPLDTDWYQD